MLTTHDRNGQSGHPELTAHARDQSDVHAALLATLEANDIAEMVSASGNCAIHLCENAPARQN